jgi:hypothetical protein
VLEVKVSAFPAIKLLWHRADSVVVRMASYRSTPGHLGSTLGDAADTGSLDASAAELDAGLLTLRDARLVKRGDRLSGTARVSETDLRASLPGLQAVTPVASGNGQLTLRGTATLLGVTGSLAATVSAVDGKLVVQPDIPFGGFATITVFSNPRVAVQSVDGHLAGDGFLASASGRLR